MPRNTARPTQVNQYLGRKNASCIEDARELSTLPPVPHSISIVYSWFHRLRSLTTPLLVRRLGARALVAGYLPRNSDRRPAGLALRISSENSRVERSLPVQFERRMNWSTTRNNYEYLDILDRAWSASGLARPVGGVVCDVGCASFWYAATLAAFFRPRELVGVEVEGHRLFQDGRARIDYAAGYTAHTANSRFVVADYVSCELPADVITAWFPFITPTAILAWRLPLSLLEPERLFARVYHNLCPGGLFVMVNHGEVEAHRAAELCVATGFRCVARCAEPGVLSGERPSPAVLTCWTRA